MRLKRVRSPAILDGETRGQPTLGAPSGGKRGVVPERALPSAPKLSPRAHLPVSCQHRPEVAMELIAVPHVGRLERSATLHPRSPGSNA